MQDRINLGNLELLLNGPDEAPATIILAHGAGAGMDTKFMNTYADGLAGHGFRVVRFEFPYMTKRRETGGRRPPDREPVLRETWLRIIESVHADALVIGGQIASLIADEVERLVCLGYRCHQADNPKG